jgi:1-aminocyclopropane-1-carboxylate deaminase
VKSVNQFLPALSKKVVLAVKREDLIDPEISGNKYRKLKYNLLAAKSQNHKSLLTFGGAYSNHVAAVAAVGKKLGFQTIGIIRGDELSTAGHENPTLANARKNEMQLEFISREDYKNKENPEFLESLAEKFGRFYLLPEGGTNALAVQGCEEILDDDDIGFDYLCCAAGTGGTAAGIINSLAPHQQLLVFPALKGAFVAEEISRFAKNNRWQVVLGYDFGGYAKINLELVDFINDFYRTTGIPLDPIYTGKLLFGVMDLVKKDFFPKGAKVLVIHTGGIQGIQGMNDVLKNRNLPLIETDA